MMNLALAIHVFRKSRRPWLLNLALLGVTAVGYFLWSPEPVAGETDVVFRSYPMMASLSLALFAFHFTEGTRRAGFGSYPTRLFVLPISSFRLVAVPMGLGVVTVVGMYLVWARLILPLVNVQLNLLWPCLFIGAATLGFQALVWTLAGYQTAKLFGLGIFGTLMMCSWVLLKEDIATAMVAAVSPSLRVEQVVPLFLASIALTGFSAGYVAVRRQRHRSMGGTGGNRHRWWRALSVRLERQRKFATPEAALFWHEWRLLGRVLPMSVAMVCGLMLLLSAGIGDVSPQATVNVIVILGLLPISLAGVLGTEFGKPDFWSRGLVQLPYLLTQPVPHAAYVAARVKVAAASVALAWGMTATTMVVWVKVFADERVIAGFKGLVRLSYGSHAWWSLVGFALLFGVLITLRLLCAGLWMTMLGKPRFYSLSGSLRGILGMGLVVGLVFIPDWQGDRSWLTTAVRFVSGGLCVLGVAHGVLIALSWSWVLQTERSSQRQFDRLCFWSCLFVIVAGWLGCQALTEVHWIRLLCWQWMLWCFPLLACGLGIAARMKGKGISLGHPWRIGPVVVGTAWAGLSIWLGISANAVLPVLADAGGHDLRMLARGEGKPVVVLEQFGSGPLEPWSKIQNRVAEFATVVAYEHAGGAASGLGPPPRDAKTIAKELRSALKSMDLQPPFVMVGHSFGGPYIRVFAGEYPDDVAGLVLVDPSSEEFFRWLRREHPEINRVSAKDRRDQTELGMNWQSFGQAEAAGIPQMPTIVITGARQKDNPTALQLMPRWIAAHRNWVALLPEGQHLISTNSGHAIPFEEPEIVVNAIRTLVERLRRRP